MTQRVVTQQELQDTLAFWRRHEDALQDSHRVSDDALYWLRLYTKPSSIGYDFSQIRPGKLGQWDIFEMLVECLSFEDRLLISGLSTEEVARTELDDAYGLNPEDPRYEQDRTQIEHLEALTPVQLDTEISQLEGALSR